MVEDLKEFDKLIKEKNISDVDTMLRESKKAIIANSPDLGERYQKVVIARGNVIEASIKIEMAFDELITKTGGEDLIINPEKKEFHLITGARKENELGSLGFNGKVKIIKKILKKLDDQITYSHYLQSKDWENKNHGFIDYFKKCSQCGGTEQLYTSHINYNNLGKEDISDVEVLCGSCQFRKKPKPVELPNNPEPPLLADLEKFVAIRDIFAHVPVSWFAKELEFDDNPRYNHFFKLNQKWKSLPIAINEFMSLQQEILNLISVYIQSIVLKRELFSKVLFGKGYEDMLKEARDKANKLSIPENSAPTDSVEPKKE